MAAEGQGIVARCIRLSLAQPGLLLLLTIIALIAAVWPLGDARVDAVPDLGDVQVIVRAAYPGQTPQVVEDQLTFPLTTALASVPGASTVRGYSLMGDAFVYVLFDERTDPYSARARVFERINTVQSRLPAGARVSLGPEATSVGWVYEYALVDRTGGTDISQLRSLQDWWLKFELQSLDGVAEVATVGGMVKEYQVVVDPDRLRAFGVPLASVRAAIEQGNGATGGSVIELAEADYIVRANAYVHTLDDLRRIPLRTSADGVAVTIEDVADVRLGPELRSGVAELNGEGEVVGGIVIALPGTDVRRVVAAVKDRLQGLTQSLPAGVEIVETYDRSALIHRTTTNLLAKIIEECVVILVICAVFLRHLRSGLAIVLMLPLGLIIALAATQALGIEANVMSLGGLAIAIGTMVDAAVVMVENVHKRIESSGESVVKPRSTIVAEACVEVGPLLVVALLIIAVSFLPVLMLEGQEGRLFSPLVYTKTFAVLAAAVLSMTLVPVLIALLVRGRLPLERANPVNRASIAAYKPLLALSLRYPRAVLACSVLAVISSVWPATRLGTEFMPDLDEGDLLYMPSTLPGISIDAARAWLQQTNRAIKEIPEVVSVFGKAGRAESSTDPAPLEMLETLVRLKPRAEWRAGLTNSDLLAELEAAVALPGVRGVWLPPIKAREEMAATGTRSEVGVAVVGPRPEEIERLAIQIEDILERVTGVESVYAERVASRRYVDIEFDRGAAARFGVSAEEFNEIVNYAVGGAPVGEVIEGRERYPINVRYPQHWRDSPEQLERLPILTRAGRLVALGDIARIAVAEGPQQIRTEDARPVGWIHVTTKPGELRRYVVEARRRIEEEIALPPGYSIRWTGAYEYFERATARLAWAGSLALLLIFAFLWSAFRRHSDALIILGALPVALVGGVWTLWLLGYPISVGAAVGILALCGVAAETGIVMLLYLNGAWARRSTRVQPSEGDLLEAITEGALARLRPKLMTVTAIIASLLPIMFGQGAGSEVMRRIAAPIVGGMISATALSLLVVPALFLLTRRRSLAETSSLALQRRDA